MFSSAPRSQIEISIDAIYGLDIAFDTAIGRRDVVVNSDRTDFAYVSGVRALAQELQRMFDCTPVGSCLGDEDDLIYGVDWDFVGVPNDPRVTMGLVKLAVLRSLQHPSFKDRFRVRSLNVQYNPAEPKALRVIGLLELFEFEGQNLVRFGANFVSRNV